MTLLAEARPFGEVASDLGAAAGASVMLPTGVETLVSVSFEDVDGEHAFRVLSEQVGMIPVYEKGIVRFVKPGEGADGFGVFFPGYDLTTDFMEGIKAILPKSATARVIGGRVVVVADSDGLQRAGEFQRHVEAAGPDGWVLDVTLLAVSESLRRDLGLTWAVNGRAGAGFDAAIGNREAAVTPVLGARAAAAIDVIARATEEGRDASIVSTGTMHVLEGKDSELQQGSVIPIPQRTVSDQGTVTTTGFTTIKTGFNVTCKGTRVPGGLMVELAPKLSGVSGFVDGHPIVDERSVRGTAVLRSGEWMILSGLDSAELSREGSGIPGLPARLAFGGERVTADKRSMLVAVRAIRIYAAGQPVE